MKVDDCYQLGYVIKTHGLKGEIQLFLDVDDPYAYQNLESVLLLQGKALIPFFLTSIQINGNKCIAKFDDIDSIDQAQALVSSQVYLPLSQLSDLDDGEYYYHQLIGLNFFDGDLELGKVEQVYELSPQYLISLTYKEKEVMIPINDEIIRSVDFENNKVSAKLPEGLLDIYLEDDEN